MIYKPKDRCYYRVKFMWHGQLIHKCTRATDAKTARSIEAKIRTELVRGNWDILELKPSPTLGEFLRKDFFPYTQSKFKTKPNTLDYYKYGSKSLLTSDLAHLRLDEITDQHARHYEDRKTHLKPTTINRGLRTPRRALSLATQWGKLDRMPKISLARGERQRERVLSDEEATLYLAACRQPWRDVATVMLGTGMCPGELFTLCWEHVLLNEEGGLIQILLGKTKARRRFLPMVPAVYHAFRTRHEAQGRPNEGWVFPAGSKTGHLGQGTAKGQHARALKASGVKRFEPYCLRHTALTNLAKAGCDAFTPAKIAGHSKISTTERYIHPAEDTIQRAFEKIAERRKLVTNGGHQENKPMEESTEAEGKTSEISKG